MARVFTSIDPSALLGAEKVEEYEAGVWYCYAPSKDGKHILLAIIEESKTGYVVDAENDVIALIPSSTPTVEKPKPLYDTYIKAYGRTVLHIGSKIDAEFYFGHRVLYDALSSRTWEDIRKLEYQIAKPEKEPEELLMGVNGDEIN